MGITATATTEPKARIVIDLDELIPDVRYIKLRGEEHPLAPPSVEMYLTVMKKHERMKHANTEVEQTEIALDLITLACETLDRSVLLKLPLPALLKVADNIQDMMAVDVEEATEPSTETGE